MTLSLSLVLSPSLSVCNLQAEMSGVLAQDLKNQLLMTAIHLQFSDFVGVYLDDSAKLASFIDKKMSVLQSNPH